MEKWNENVARTKNRKGVDHKISKNYYNCLTKYFEIDKTLTIAL